MKTIHCFRGLMVWAVLGLPAMLWGFDLRTDESGRYIVKWYEESIELDIHLKNTQSTHSSSRTLAEAFQAAINTWNAEVEIFEIEGREREVKSDADRNGVNEVVEAFRYRGQQLGSSALAVTFNYRRNANELEETDIVFTNQVSWDDYDGPLEDRVDLHRVALHELGHVLSLLHPDDAGQSVDAIMNSVISEQDELTEDDISGVRLMFGVPGFNEPNDDISGASEVPDQATGSWSDRATNVNASREPGEPAHVEVGKGRSLWWRWQPAEDRHLAVTTFGSDFDTTLAVYRGTGLPDLELIDENDDEETPEQNPGPDRKRTSVVFFNATAGETYHIAVDGWGPEPDFVPTLHGEVEIGFTFDDPWIPTEITRQPVETVVAPGAIGRMVVEATAYPELAYQWQRRPAGSEAWEFIAASESGYRGVDTARLEVDALAGRDGDEYRCVITNEAGQVISHRALLRFDPTSLPEFQQPTTDQTLILTDDAVIRVEPSNFTGIQWYRDGAALPGATGDELDLGDLSQFEDGTYEVILTGPNGDVSSGEFQIAVDQGALMRLKNLSVRSTAAEGASTLVAGFAVSGEGSQPLILRGVGPGLGDFGVAGFASDPQVRLYDASQSEIDFNDNWVNSPEVTDAFETVGAFPLAAGSGDAVLFRSVEPGPYSAHITRGNGSAGIVVVEGYDATGESEATTRLSNLSARTQVGSGESVLIAGFVLEGPGRKRLLIRAVGPTLAGFGIPAASLLSNPLLEVRSGAEVIASNDDWSGSTDLQQSFGQVGAFALPDGSSLDSAVVVELPAGVYTATVSGAEGGTGVALVEVYELP